MQGIALSSQPPFQQVIRLVQNGKVAVYPIPGIHCHHQPVHAEFLLSPSQLNECRHFPHPPVIGRLDHGTGILALKAYENRA